MEKWRRFKDRENLYFFFLFFNRRRTIIILFRISRVKICVQLLSTILFLVTTSLSLSLFLYLLFDPTSVKYAKFVKRVINAVLLYTLTLQHLW